MSDASGIDNGGVESEEQLSQMATRFRAFAALEAAGYSPLYDALCLAIADDPQVLTLATHAKRGQPPPNLLLGAVHYLLLRGTESRLREYYPSLGGHLPPDQAASDLFRAFCLDHWNDIEALLESRLVQTNEVGRSACLMPAFAHVASLANGPIALLEVGASAGLNLLCDRYHYDYGEAGTAGDPASPVRLRCEAIGGSRPPIDALPAIAYRAGVDLDPVDVNDADKVLWLRALIWPEHRERASAFEAAVSLAREAPPKVLAGDGIEMLPELVAAVPEDLTICVFHSFVMNQVARERRERFDDLLARCAWKRPVFDVSFEGTAAGVRTAAIEMARSVRGEWRRAVLAKCQAHGQSIEWLIRSPREATKEA